MYALMDKDIVPCVDAEGGSPQKEDYTRQFIMMERKGDKSNQRFGFQSFDLTEIPRALLRGCNDLLPTDATTSNGRNGRKRHGGMFLSNSTISDELLRSDASPPLQLAFAPHVPTPDEFPLSIVFRGANASATTHEGQRTLGACGGFPYSIRQYGMSNVKGGIRMFEYVWPPQHYSGRLSPVCVLVRSPLPCDASI
jgi:hypothetical protein